MSAVTSPYGPTAAEMLSESVYNFAASTSRRSTGGGSTGDQDSDSQHYDQTSSHQLQLAASIQSSSNQSSVPLQQQPSSSSSGGGSNKPRNKRKNFKPISSRMAEVSDESEERDDDEANEAEVNNDEAAVDDYEGLAAIRSKAMLLQQQQQQSAIDDGREMVLVEEEEDDEDDEDDNREDEERRDVDEEESSPGRLPDEVAAATAKLQRLNNNEVVIPMDLSVATRPPSSDGDDDSADSYRHKFILERKLYSPGLDVRSPASESSDKSTAGSGAAERSSRLDEHHQLLLESGQDELLDERNLDLEMTGNDTDDADDQQQNHQQEEQRGSARSYDNIREYAESTMQELFAIYGLAGGDIAKSVSRQLPPSFMNPSVGQHLQQGNRAKLKDDKDASSMAPGSPPTPPHTPQSPSRQNSAANLSSSQSSRASNAGSPSVQHQQAAAAATAAGLHPSLTGSPLSQILVQNPALAQLLQQNPAILTQNPQLAQLLQQNLQVQMGGSIFTRRGDDTDDSRVLPTIAGLAAKKVEATDPKVSALLRQAMSPVSAEALSSASGAKSSPTATPQPVIDVSRYVRRYSSGQECGSSYCKDLGCREHFHCLDCSGRVFVKKEEMIRHFKWHKKRDESLLHGFMRYSSTDDCTDRYPSRPCPHNRKQTHYHCIHDNCDKVYISTSDVQMHANYHRKDSAILQEGFQRFRATENCATEYCPFSGQRTTHFHCRRNGCQYTFKNKADMDKHKSYHIKDEQLSRDGFKKFMKSEACPFEQCRFSRVCNHIHCIRPQCSYVLHSSGQLFSHKRKHERNDSELAYRKYKQISGGNGSAAGLPPGSMRGGGSWAPDDLNSQGLSLSLNGESSNEGRGSPSYYSMDDSFQSASDLAMDLTATTTTASGAGTSTPLGDNQQLTPTELAYLMPATPDCGCGLDREHYHCALDRCGGTLRDPREVREHLREHETQERITDAFFEEGCCDESSCPYADKEKHYHCNWENCREVILATDKPFRRLQHYKIHEYSRHLNLSGTSHPLPSDVTLTHLTNIDAMFRRKRGRPPKNRVIEIWSEGDPATHTQDTPQAIFTSFKLPKPTPTAAASCSSTSASLPASSNALTITPIVVVDDDREDSMSPVNSDPVVGFSTYNQDACPDLSCSLRSSRHHHCSQPRCHFSTDRPDQLLMHSKDFHDNVEIPPGFAFYDRTIDCRLAGCNSNRTNRHFHCTRPGCGYSFVRYSTMALHEKQHDELAMSVSSASIGHEEPGPPPPPLVMPHETKPRIQVKNPAELIDKQLSCVDEDPKEVELVSSGDGSNKTTVVRAAGTYYPVSGPPSEPALPGAILSMRASVHQEPSQLSTSTSSIVSSPTLTSSSHTLYGPEQSCSRPFCKLKRKNHYHCNACNQAFSEVDKLVAHIAKHSASAILSQQQIMQPLELQPQQTSLFPPSQQQPQLQQQPQQQQPSTSNHQQQLVQQHEYLAQLSQQAQKHDFMSQNVHMAQNLQSFQSQMQRQMQQNLQHQQQQTLPLKAELKLEPTNQQNQSSQPLLNIKREQSLLSIKREQPLLNIKREQPDVQEINSVTGLDSHENGQQQGQQQQQQQQQQPQPMVQMVVGPNVAQQQQQQQQQQQPPPGFELDLGHGFHFPSPAVMAAMNQQIALMNQGLPSFLQHGSMYAGAPGLMFAPGLPPGNFLPGPGRDDNPLASLAANLNLTKRSLSPSDANSAEAKKQRLHHSMRMLKDEPVPEGYIRFRFNEDCRYAHCGYREHQTHFHCMRQDCGYSFCDKTRFVQHTARHERLDTLMGGDFQQYRANVPCGRGQCAYTSSLGSMQNKASHFHCLKCDFVCTDTNKVVAHRRQHAKQDSIAAAGFQKFTPSQPCGAVQCQHSGKQTHYHCLQCKYAVLGLAQMSAHKYRHMDA